MLGGQTTERGRLRKPREDHLVSAARSMLYVGLFLSSLLSLRVGPATIGDLFILGSAGVLACSLRKPRVPNVHTGALLFTAMLILMGGFIAAYHTLGLVEHLSILARLVFLVLVLPWQARLLLDNDERFGKATITWAAGCAVAGASTIAQAYISPSLIPGGGIQNGRYAGFTGHVSDTGGITACAVVFGIASIAMSPRGTPRLRLAILIAGGGIGLLLSGSVSGMLAVVATCLVLLVRGHLRLARTGVVMVAAVLALVAVTAIQSATPGALTPWQRIQQVTGHREHAYAGAYLPQLDTSASRLESDQLALSARSAQPFIGTGLDQQSSLVETRYQDLPPHNLLIGALYEGGVLLLLGFLVVIGLAVRRGWRLPPTVPHGPIFAAFLTTLVFAMTAPSLYSRYFWIPLVLTLTADGLARRQDASVDQMGRDL